MSRDKRSELLTYVWESPLSDFYRTHHAETMRRISLPLTTEEDWLPLPTITREEVGRIPLLERIYTDPKDIFAIRPTSGTSGRSICLSPPASAFPAVRNFQESGVPVSGALAFMNPQHIFEGTIGDQFPIIGGDPLFPELSISMAQKLSVNVLLFYPFLIANLTPYLKASGLGPHIRGVYPFGEYLSERMREQFADLFPNALFINSYGASELYGEVATRTFHAKDWREPGPYRPRQGEYFLELETDSMTTAEPTPGMEGELIVTTTGPVARAFPMIRYRTGDQVRVFDVGGTGCFAFDVLGRSALDKIKLMGGVLWPHEIERALSAVFGSAFRGDYLFERALDESGKEYGIVHLPEELFPSPGTDAPERMAREMRVTSVRTYADGVRDGFYAPLKFVQLRNTGDAPRKARRIKQGGTDAV